MANQEHLDILARGVEAWNAWRAENPEIRPDLSEANLYRADLRRANFSWANLSWANLSGANLYRADLRRADLSGAFLNEADLQRALLNEADLHGADLYGAFLSRAFLNEANLRGANLSGTDLSRTVLKKANLIQADLHGADLYEADLRGADLRGANLRGANLREANLREANLNGADLNGADLREANLREANLREMLLTEADLSGAHLSGADLHGATIGYTIFADTYLNSVQGLDSVRHGGPSTIGIDTLYRSRGQIPAAFLRGCGVPDSFIDSIPYLFNVLQPIQYYSCFISYSTKDEDFARRLHERMRAEHLRVWFAPEDIKGGEKLYDQIDRAIQFHDRLLLVLSAQSMQSEWVMTEIRRARRQEIKEQRRKLFPIRLTDFAALRDWSCFDADHGKDLAVEVREYFIPDFSDWKQHDVFEEAFARLLRDLRAAESPTGR